MSVHTVIVNGYNVKFTKNRTFIRVSIPLHRCEIDTSSDNQNFSKSFVTELKNKDWSFEAIYKLHTYILDAGE